MDKWEKIEYNLRENPSVSLWLTAPQGVGEPDFSLSNALGRGSAKPVEG